MRLTTTILAIFLAVLTCTAQHSVKLRGSVNDTEGNAIPFASVRVDGQGGTLTDLNGKYSLTVNAADSIAVSFSMTGYRTIKRVVRSPRDTIVLKVVLPQSDYALAETTVKGQRVQSSTMQSIKTKDLNNLPSTTGNGVEELVSTMAGVSRHDELSSQYNVRGGSFDENLVYLNGQEIYRPMLVSSGNQEGLSVINSDMVERIEFSTGGFPAKYGDKMSSVLDIKYRKPRKAEAKLNASLLGGGMYAGWGNDKFSVMGSVRYKTTRYMLSTLETNGEYSPDFLDLQTYISWTPNKNWSLDFIGNFSNNRYNFKPQDRETRFGTLFDSKKFKVYFDGEERDLFRTYYGAFTVTRNLGSKSHLSLLGSAYKTNEHEAYDIQGQYWLNEQGSQEELGVGTYREHARNYLNATVANIALRYSYKSKVHEIESAVSLQTQQFKETSSEWEMRDSAGYSIPNNSDRLQLYYNLHADETVRATKLEAYIQDTYRFTAKPGNFTFNYGARLTHWSWNGETIVSPRASLGFIPKANDNWIIRIATGLYCQTPFYKEIRDTTTTANNTVVNLNRNIKSQRSWQAVIGGDYNFRLNGRPFKFTAEVYYKGMSRLIPYNVNNVRTVYYGRNMCSGYAVGIDTKIFGEFVPGTDSWVTFSVMQTKEKFGNKWVPRPTDQRYNLSIYFTDFFPGTQRWKLSLRGALADGLPFGPTHSGREKMNFRAPAYKRVDIGMNYNLYCRDDSKRKTGIGQAIKNVWLGIDAFNVLGINNVNSYYWVTDINGNQYAVPNYLTGRLVNLRLSLEF
jgi:hypothetical protein